MLYSVRDGAPSYAHCNARGDVVGRTDAAGNFTWQASYEAFGMRLSETGSTPERQRANTKDEDPTGLLNEGFRYRDLESGTFISRDPAGFVDGPNLYCYVVQNPWTKFDPLGLQEGDSKDPGDKAYIDPAVKGNSPIEAQKHYETFVSARKTIYDTNKELLDKNQFTTSDKGPETVTYDPNTGTKGKPGNPPLNPKAEALWKQIYVDDGKGKRGSSSQLGECASMPINLTGVTAKTKKWKPGPVVVGNEKIKPGTAIATFNDKGDYNGTSGGHSAIFISSTSDSITVVEQYNPGHGGRAPQIRTLPLQVDVSQSQLVPERQRDYSNTANWFRVIQTKK